jgi:hypothetical protein
VTLAKISIIIESIHYCCGMWRYIKYFDYYYYYLLAVYHGIMALIELMWAWQTLYSIHQSPWLVVILMLQDDNCNLVSQCLAIIECSTTHNHEHPASTIHNNTSILRTSRTLCWQHLGSQVVSEEMLWGQLTWPGILWVGSN